MLRAADLNARIVIQAQSAAQDSLGQHQQSWSDVCTVWSSIKQKSGLATVRADEISAATRASIRIRYRTDLTEGMRTSWGGDCWMIKTILADPQREYLDLVCERVE